MSAPTTPVTTHRRSHTTPRMTREEYAARKDLATMVAGYDTSNPVWGKTLIALLEEMLGVLSNGSLPEDDRIDRTIETLRNLQKREAYNRIKSGL